MEVIISALQESDISEFYEMNNELNDIVCGTLESMKESLGSNKGELIYIAKHENKAIGFICGQLYSSICYTSKQGEVTELYVREDYRRMGVASKLINHIENEMIKNNVHEITVITGQKNINAQGLYEKCGYDHKRIAYIKQFYY